MDLQTNKTYISSNVIFVENIFPCSEHISQNSSQTQSYHAIPPLLLVPNISLPPTLAQASPDPSPLHKNSPTLTQAKHTNAHNNNINQTNMTTSATISTSHTSPHSNPDTQQIPNLPSQPIKPIHPMLTRFKDGVSKPKKIFDLTHIIQPSEPTTYNQAVKSEHWRRAMSQEFQALQSQGTWELV